MSGEARRFAWRGWILAAGFLILATARWRSQQPLQPGGLGLVASAMAFRLAAGRHIGAHSNGLRMEGGSLATTGPYAISRHPLYLSNLGACAGLLVFANCLPAWGLALFFAAAAFQHRALALAEESQLLAAHGDAWRRYRDITPRWLGLPKGGGSAGAASPWGEAWRRQGANLAKTGAGALLLGALAWA